MPIQNTGAEQRHEVAVHGIHVATHATRRVANGNGAGSTERLEQLPTLGREYPPEQLWRLEYLPRAKEERSADVADDTNAYGML